jgi:hypothetical protein
MKRGAVSKGKASAPETEEIPSSPLKRRRFPVSVATSSSNGSSRGRPVQDKTDSTRQDMETLLEFFNDRLAPRLAIL